MENKGEKKDALSLEEQEFNEDFRRIFSEIIILSIEDNLALGNVTFAGLSKDEALNKALSFGRDKIKRSDFSKIVVDHREKLIDQARSLHKQKDLEGAVIMYATWVEHWLNKIVSIGFRKNNMSDKEIENAIRNTNIESKSTWLLRLMGYPEIDEDSRKKIKALCEKRNSIVHYKYKVDVIGDDAYLDKLIFDFEGCIKQLIRYEQITVIGEAENLEYIRKNLRSKLKIDGSIFKALVDAP